MEKQRNKKEKTMKRPVRKIILALTVILIALCIGIGAVAQTNGADVRSENLTYGGSRITLLDERCIDHYMQKAAVDENRADTKTCAVIQGYVSEIRALIFSDRVDREDLRAEIELLYQKGMASGILSCIYYSNSDVSDSPAVLDTYRSQIDIINSKGIAENDFFESGNGRSGVEGCYTLLLQSVYSEKINRLACDGDSETVRGMILSAPSSLGSNCAYDNTNGDGEDGSNYRNFFETVKNGIEIQRNRDGVAAEMRAVFSKLYPDYDFDKTALLADFRNSLNTKTSVSDMNYLASETLLMLLEGLKREGADYRNSFLNSKKGETVDEAARANSEQNISVLSVARIFSDFPEMLCLADVEDFRSIHSEILSKREINASDRELLVSAISHASRLPILAETVLESELTFLGNAYKTATVDAMKSVIKKDRAEALRVYAAERLSELVSSISPKDKNGRFALSALKDRADLYYEKSVEADRVLSEYDREYLGGVTRFFGSEVSAEVKEAIDGIIDAVGGSEEKTVREIILKLARFAALERIYTEAYGFEGVEGMSALLENTKAAIEKSTDRSSITVRETSAIAEIARLVRADAYKNSRKEIDLLYEKIKSELQGYRYISSALREELVARITEIRSEAYTDIENASDGVEIGQIRSRATAELDSVFSSAYGSEKSACLNAVRNELKARAQEKDRYSKENYEALSALMKSLEERLLSAQEIAEYEAIRDDGVEKIGKIESLVDTAKREGKESLLSEYSRLLAKKDCYSAESLAKLEEIYSRSLFELDMLDESSSQEAIRELVNERIALMSGVKMDKIYTGNTSVSPDGSLVAPEGYSPAENGYAGSVYSPGGISSESKLTISHADSDGIDEVLKRAAKKKHIFYADGSAVEKALLKKIKNCNVIGAVDIDLGEYLEGREYTVSMLLPEGMDISEVFGIVFVRDDGTVEFYGVTAADAGIDFTVGHFSRYYIISEGRVNLLPLIICLFVIVLCEIAILLALIARRRKKYGEEREAIDLGAFAPIVLSVKYTPKGGVSAVIILGILAATLSSAIVYLLLPDIAELRRKIGAKKMRKAAPEIEPLSLEDTPCPALCAVTTEFSVPETADETVDTDDGNDTAETEFVALSAPLASVSAEEAEMLMSDEDAKNLRSEEIDPSDSTEGNRKAEINIDTICRMYYAGDTVTLKSLKEKKLVGQRVGSVKILGRGIVDKPLRVVAQDFSASAIKMILLTGGEAILSRKNMSKK